MAFRIDKALVRGEISNEERGFVTGRVWLAGRKEPLLLNLQGNCLRDLAGSRLTFHNPQAEVEPHLETLAAEQTGLVGDMAASRKVKVPTVTDAELYDLVERHETVPFRLANCLYLEWYSEENGRVLIETVRCQLEVSSPAWTMTEEEEQRQMLASQHHFHQFIDSITGDTAVTEGEPTSPEKEDGMASRDEPGDGDRTAIDLELNEFEWEQELREADRRAAAYQEAFEKYKDHPERERMIAEALHWEEIENNEATRVFGLDEGEANSWNEESEEEDPVDMSHHHPLSQRAMDFALTLQREAEERGLMAESGELRDNAILSLILHIIALGGKLAGALDGWAQGLDPEPGFIIAMLKRAQVPLNEALHAFDCIDTKSLNEETRLWLQARKREIFELRKEILDLMQELRAGL
ncbi:MAG: hypothetical protein ACR2OZ_17105 [Verrucomicrobiales bacterium]